MFDVTDIGPFTSLIGLLHLDCSGMFDVTDIGPLAALTNLH